MNNKINAHILQKALVKNFAINNKVKCVRYLTNEKWEFNINSHNSKQPITKVGYYSDEIEKGMNHIENYGITTVNKIIFDINNNKDVILSRKQLMVLKFFVLLTSARTEKLRNNIAKKDGDSFFNAAIERENKTPQEIQENQIKIIMEEYLKNKLGIVGDVQAKINKLVEIPFQEKYKNYKTFSKSEFTEKYLSFSKENTTVEIQSLISIKQTFDSRTIFFKIDDSRLFLQESNQFTENNKHGGIMYTFTTLSPNVGVMFYHAPVLTRNMIEQENSVIFKNSISKFDVKTNYENWEIMKSEHIKFIKKHMKDYSKQTADMLSRVYWSSEAAKYHTDNDTYTYTVKTETSDVADACNAMTLVHNKGHFLIYQKEEHIKDAEYQIKKRGIYRIEDYT